MNTPDTETKAPKILDLLHETFKKRKSPATKSEAAGLMKAYKAAHKKKSDAEAALVKAQAEETEAVRAIVEARGKGRFEYEGDVFTPMCKGETLFLRNDSVKDVPGFGS